MKAPLPLERSRRAVLLSALLFGAIALAGVLVVLYAWNLPPFRSAIQSTENALVRGPVTIISPQLAGYVVEVPVQDFQQVKQGDLLVRLDDRIYQQKLEQARALLAVQQQGKTGAALAGAEATVRLAEIDLSNTRVLAPRDGQLGPVGVRQGAWVNAGSQLTAIVPDQLWVIANLKETQMAKVAVGQPVVLTVDALDNARLGGHVERIAPATGSEFSVLAPDNATGNYVKIAQRIPVRISLDPNQPLVARLRPGMSVVASIDTGKQR
jgi:multidrug resistance efflux pump